MNFLSKFDAGITWIRNWLNHDVYGFFEETMQELVAWFVIAKLEFMLWTIQFSWGVAKQIMFNFGVGDYVAEAFSGLDPVLMGYLNFFRIVEAINMIIQAVITRITLKVMGW